MGVPYLVAVGAWKLATLLLWGIALGAAVRLIGGALGLADPLAGNDLVLAYLGLGWAGIATVLKLFSLSRKKDLR